MCLNFDCAKRMRPSTLCNDGSNDHMYIKGVARSDGPTERSLLTPQLLSSEPFISSLILQPVSLQFRFTLDAVISTDAGHSQYLFSV